MFIIYNLIFFIFAIFYLPLYFLRGKLKRGFAGRLGYLPAGLSLNRPIWIHAVSVGEVVAIKGLLGRLRQVYPEKKFVISTVTATGNKIARGLIKEGDFLTYLPLDFSFIIYRVLKKTNPCVFIIAETEIWPNLISSLNKLKVPVVTVNGRISDASYRGYLLVKVLIRPILRMVNKFCVQSSLDAFRLESLGVAREKIQVTGNVKFDINLDPVLPADVLSRRAKLWLKPEDKLWVCGSTHPGEEEIIFDAYHKLLTVLPNLKLLIAPRHPERSRQVSKLAQERAFMPVLISNISAACPTCINQPVFILDYVGELFNYYSAADVVFIGGSLVKHGGHNILEPASLKKPVVFGPHMFNFRDISELFLAGQAAMLIANSQELVDKVKEILGSSLLAKGLGERAYDLIVKNRGATERNIQVIKQIALPSAHPRNTP
jgi:3-deoxy-D-manno-octulosonic-acid transferase